MLVSLSHGEYNYTSNAMSGIEAIGIASEEVSAMEIQEKEQVQGAKPGDGKVISLQNNLNVMNATTHSDLTKAKSTTKEPPKKRKRAQAVEIIKRENSKNVSEIWGHFTRLEGSNPPRAACNYCGTSYAAHSKHNGTTGLWAHLESICKKYPFKSDKRQKTMHDYKTASGDPNDNSTIKIKIFNPEEFRKNLVKMVIIDGLPFKIVEGEGFRAYSRGLEPRFEVPSRHTVARDCMKIFLEEKKKLKRVLKNQRVCLTTDTWTSLQVGLSTMLNKGDYDMTSMAIRMKEKFNKYWGNIDNINWLLFVAVLLDPRYKLKYVSFGFATIYEGSDSFLKRMTNKMEELLGLLYKHYSDSDSHQMGKNDLVVQDYNYMQVDGYDDPSELLESRFAKHLEEEQCVESKSEVARYLLDGCEKSSKDFDVLNWWKVNTSKYPILSKVARDVLAIPVSTIASESAFSTSGRVIDPFRSSLSPQMVEALICSQDWLRATPSPIDLRAAMEDIEQFEKLEKDLDESSCSVVLDD